MKSTKIVFFAVCFSIACSTELSSNDVSDMLDISDISNANDILDSSDDVLDSSNDTPNILDVDSANLDSDTDENGRCDPNTYPSSYSCCPYNQSSITYHCFVINEELAIWADSIHNSTVCPGADNLPLCPWAK